MQFTLHRAALAVILVCVLAFLFAYAPPLSFSPGTIVSVEPGTSKTGIADVLARENVIAHPFALELALRILGPQTPIQSGDYRFEKPEGVITIARRLMQGAYDLPLVRLTFPEGITVREQGERIAAAFPLITASSFISAAQSQEGYLFPDTYFFPVSSTQASIIATLRATFDAKIAPLSGDVAASGRSLSDIIIMASLIEKEARSTANKNLVAGILWNRIERDMPLQVDAVFGYIFNRDTYVPSGADLKVDSPYNTYTHRGLPPGPIDNPGLESIAAALHPTQTAYLYYLTGSDNLMHYAKTYAEHQANQKKYLK